MIWCRYRWKCKPQISVTILSVVRYVLNTNKSQQHYYYTCQDKQSLSSSTFSLHLWSACCQCIYQNFCGVTINPKPKPIISVCIPSFWLCVHEHKWFQELVQPTESSDPSDGWQPPSPYRRAIINYVRLFLTARNINGIKHKLLLLSLLWLCHWILDYIQLLHWMHSSANISVTHKHYWLEVNSWKHLTLSVVWSQ